MPFATLFEQIKSERNNKGWQFMCLPEPISLWNKSLKCHFCGSVSFSLFFWGGGISVFGSFWSFHSDFSCYILGIIEKKMGETPAVVSHRTGFTRQAMNCWFISSNYFHFSAGELWGCTWSTSVTALEWKLCSRRERERERERASERAREIVCVCVVSSPETFHVSQADLRTLIPQMTHILRKNFFASKKTNVSKDPRFGGGAPLHFSNPSRIFLFFTLLLVLTDLLTVSR